MYVKYAFDYPETNTGIQEREIFVGQKKKQIFAFEQVEFET